MITLYYEGRFGLGRGAVFHKGRPHLYAEGLETDPSLNLLAVRSIARLKGRGGGVIFLELADGGEAILDGTPDILAKLNNGVAVEIEIAAEARQGKLARARLLRLATGETLQRLSAPLTLKDRLLAQARDLIGDGEVDEASDTGAIDEAEEGALNPSGPLPGGGFLSVERTRALIACDVDFGGGGDGIAQTAKGFARKCNEAAVAEVTRRLRLSGLAGLVVVDLIGRRHDAERLRALLMSAFGAEASRIIAAPIGKFGTLEFVRPWGACPLIDLPPAPKAAHGLLREAVRRSDDRRGRTLTLRAPQDVLDRLRPLIAGSYDPLTPMLRLEAGSVCEVISS